MGKANLKAEMINGGIEIPCEHCGRYADVQRSSAFFCDQKCRNAYHNAKRKRRKDIALALQSLETLIANMPKRGDSDEWKTLIAMKETIIQAIWTVES